MAPDPRKTNLLAADYQSERETADFRRTLGWIEADAPTADRVSYLGALRSSVVALQDELNIFLTKKMEEDKASSSKADSLDDHKEEENYGEEVVEDA